MSSALRLFLDTNILLDSIARRHPFEKAADLVLALGYCQESELWTSANQYLDVFYVLTHDSYKVSTTEAKSALRKLFEFVNVCHLTLTELQSGIDAPENDLEDACIYQCARKMRADAIITRDADGFRHSLIPAMTCDELFTWLEREMNLVYDFVDLTP